MKQKSIAFALPLVLLASICTGCLLEILELPKPVLLVEPYITTQPASILYKTNALPGSPPTLTVKVDDWTRADGTLTFQWYAFDNHFNYLQGNVTPLDADPPDPVAPVDPVDPDDDEEVILPKVSSYTIPSFPSTSRGARYYYYVEVTNENPVATNKQKSTIRSEVAIISFMDDGDPSLPVITHQPADTQARFGRPVPPLSVRASVPPAEGGELFYQWYRIDVDEVSGEFRDVDHDGIPDATEVPGEIFPEFTPTASWLGNGFFYVKVTHTIGRVPAVMGPDPDDPDGEPIVITPEVPGISTSEISIHAKVEILRGLRAGTPVISVPPKAALYFANDTVHPLTVEAESPDFGALTFEWYSHTRPAVSGGTLVERQTNAETTDLLDGKRRSAFTPEITGNHFYYVVVTNTNTNVEGATTAAANTRAINVRRQTGELPTANSVLEISNPNMPSNRFNYIRGYGGMEVAWANFPETFPEDTELQYDPDKLGYNILRIMLPVSNTNIDLAMDDLVNVTKRRPHYYDNVKIVNKHGGYVAAAPWSPPKEWKSNNSINGGGKLIKTYYKQYAAYLKAFAQHMNNRGAPIYCISIQNEPNYTAGYDGCEWEPEDMAAFFEEAGRFTEGVRGWGGGRQTPRVLTMNGESANNVNINHLAIDSPAAYANIDVFGRHVYGDRRTNLWAGGFNGRNESVSARPLVQQRDGKEIWMTEHNINSANAAGYYNDSKWDYIWKFMNDIDLVMRMNNENAFVWWAGKRFYSMVGDGQYGTPPGEALPRGWGMSHYAKYTIDTTRIDFTMTGTIPGAGAVSIGGNVNGGDDTQGDMDNISARITAYAKFEDRPDPEDNDKTIEVATEISLVLWTPTKTSGAEGYDMGTIEIKMPSGFLIDSATGIESYKVNDTTNRYQEPYEVMVNTARDRAYVTLPRSRIISVKFTRQET